MYSPPAFVETRLDQLHAMIERHSFALLVTQSTAVTVATHLPLTLDRNSGPYGTLFGHVARANPQWMDLTQQSVLTVFSGPHCYVSPQWYESQHVVPTWNYVAVHAYGRVELIEDKDQLRPMIRQMVDIYERSMPTPWSMPDTARQYEDRMLDQIVGFRIVIDSIEGKWKLSQNHPRERQQKVIAQLRSQGDENSLAIASLMEQNVASEPSTSEFVRQPE